MGGGMFHDAKPAAEESVVANESTSSSGQASKVMAEDIEFEYTETIPYFLGVYSFLSNFHVQPVVYGGIEYPSAENAYQAQKTLDKHIRKDWFASPLMKPGEAKRFGRSVLLRPDWEQVKDQIMLEIVRAKFSDKTLRDLLNLTRSKVLIEGNNWHDTYWGVCNGECNQSDTHHRISIGWNKLGTILEYVRAENRKARIEANFPGVIEAALSGTITGLE